MSFILPRRTNLLARSGVMLNQGRFVGAAGVHRYAKPLLMQICMETAD